MTEQTTQLKRIDQLNLRRKVADNIYTALCGPAENAGGYFTDNQLDDELLPVAPGQKLASEHWHDLRTLHYQLRNGVTTDQQVVFTFARVAEAVLPNDLGTQDQIQKISQYMRAMQSGVQQRYAEDGVTVPRDRSEAYIAKLLHDGRQYIDGAPLLAYDLGVEAAGLKYTPIRRLSRVASGLRHTLAAVR